MPKKIDIDFDLIKEEDIQPEESIELALSDVLIIDDDMLLDDNQKKISYQKVKEVESKEFTKDEELFTLEIDNSLDFNIIT